jgi:lipoprotein-anchoring transpeptidase ErfK/SrfK
VNAGAAVARCVRDRRVSVQSGGDRRLARIEPRAATLTIRRPAGGVSCSSTPAPAGHFWIDERSQITDPSSGYYPYAFGTTDYSTLTDWPGGGVVGIHGPYYDAQGIPGYISHGCIRLGVTDDFWLAAH